MQQVIHRSKKNNIKIVKHFKKDGDYSYIVTDYQGNFIENLGNRDLESVNRYLKL